MGRESALGHGHSIRQVILWSGRAICWIDDGESMDRADNDRTATETTESFTGDTRGIFDASGNENVLTPGGCFVDGPHASSWLVLMSAFN